MRAYRNLTVVGGVAILVGCAESGAKEDEATPLPAPPAAPFSIDGGVIGGPPPSRLRELRTAAHTPPAIAGGTLAVSADGAYAVAADPDRDLVYVVETGTLKSRAVTLPNESEPGRVALDGSGAAHVALRGSGKLARIDLASASVSVETALCTQPRGVTYDAKADAILVACMDGSLITLDPQSHAERERKTLDQDLRDVVIARDGARLVSRYRSAEVLRIDTNGVQTKSRPKSIQQDVFDGGVGQSFTPTLAWRAVSTANGNLWLLHQQSKDDKIETSTGGYGSGCQTITQATVTKFSEQGAQVDSLPVALNGLVVDVAVSPDEMWAAVATPGNYLRGLGTLQVYSTKNPFSALSDAGIPFLAGPCATPALTEGSSSQITAVAFSGSTLYAFSREPAELSIYSLRDTSGQLGDASVFGAPQGELQRTLTIALDSRSARDTGHDLFHADANGGISCASCHGEALDDGHVWQFAKIGPRRTQNMRGGFLQTAPFHWDGDMTDFRHLVSEVMTSRMSGFVVEDQYATALSSWIDRQPALRLPARDAAAVERGKALFESSGTQCATCHTGEALTNNLSADVGTGGSFQVPTLRGLGLRAPYMHTGCAKTLRDRFDPACGGSKHGKTSQLSKTQIDDMIAYLQTL